MATQGSFWGVDVNLNIAQETRRDKFPGHNDLGRLLMGLWDYVSSREPGYFIAVEFPSPSVPRNKSAHRDSDMTSSDATPDELSMDVVNALCK